MGFLFEQGFEIVMQEVGLHTSLGLDRRWDIFLFGFVGYFVVVVVVEIEVEVGIGEVSVDIVVDSEFVEWV